MDELQDLLGLMQGARERWRTVRATLRDWEDVALTEGARYRGVAQDPPGSALRSGTGPRFVAAVRRVWARKPYRWRLEFESADGTNLFVGDLAWPEPRDAPRKRQTTPRDALALEALDATVAYTFDPWSVVSDLEMRVLGRVEHAGREAVRVVAVAQERQSSRLESFADDHELLVDAERGVLLRTASRLDGEEFKVTEVVAVAFDEDLPEEVFVAEDIFVAEPPPHAPGQTGQAYDERKRG